MSRRRITWRDRARPIIARVIARVGVADRRLLRRELRQAYPFGLRKWWPYRAWLSEIRFQLGIKTRGPRLRWVDDPNQLRLFEEKAAETEPLIDMAFADNVGL